MLQGASWISGRTFKLETRERLLSFYFILFFSDVWRRGGGGGNFLPLLFFVPVESIKPANQLGNASSNRP